MKSKMLYAACAATPLLLFALSGGPPPRRTGAAVDGGLSCAVCHGFNNNLANTDPRGSLTITFDSPSYTPGVAQTVHVRINHPDQLRWGFQLTARMASDLTVTAGTLNPSTGVQVTCDNGRPGPCDGAREFAQHRLAPRTAPGAGFTFDVPWTPPATNAGDVVFYASGNAADGNNIPGPADRIYTTFRTLSSPCTLTARPTLSALTDAASFRTTWSPNALLTLFGAGFAAPGARRQVEEFDLVARLFPKELACLAVEMGGVRVPVTYVGENQINAQAPTTGQNSGPVPVTIILNPGRANEVRSDVVTNNGLQRVSPALFASGGNAIAAVGANLVTPAQPARPGDIVSFYATGLGYTEPVWQAGEIPTRASPLLNPATVSIGGATLAASDVLYAGLAVGSVSGVYQINARIPASAPDGNLPVVVTVGGVASQSGVTVPVRR
jgi:uncharacterized protein (TIGR03437 family)